MTEFLEKTGYAPEEVLYMGDDLPDIPVYEMVGVGVTPQDGSEDNRIAADWITRESGGRGAVREVIERVLKLQGNWYSPEIYAW